MAMPNWTPGPWWSSSLNEGGKTLARVGKWIEIRSSSKPGKPSANAELISHAPCMADALAQWAAAEAMGDEQEMQNAREERDRILAELVGDQ